MVVVMIEVDGAVMVVMVIYAAHVAQSVKKALAVVAPATVVVVVVLVDVAGLGVGASLHDTVEVIVEFILEARGGEGHGEDQGKGDQDGFHGSSFSTDGFNRFSSHIYSDFDFGSFNFRKVRRSLEIPVKNKNRLSSPVLIALTQAEIYLSTFLSRSHKAFLP